MTRADFESAGKQWPLTVDSGELACEANAVTFETGGVVYAANGIAKGQQKGADIDPIWRDDPAYPDLGIKIGIGDLIEEGLALC